jgi:hypothetical protein
MSTNSQAMPNFSARCGAQRHDPVALGGVVAGGDDRPCRFRAPDARSAPRFRRTRRRRHRWPARLRSNPARRRCTRRCAPPCAPGRRPAAARGPAPLRWPAPARRQKSAPAGRRQSRCPARRSARDGPAQAQCQLRVVAQRGMGIQRQVVGEQVDVVRQQSRHALFAETRDAPVLGLPEPAVMHQQRIRAALGRGLDQRLAGGDPADDAPDALAAFHLQAVWAIIAKTRGVQLGIQPGAQFFTCDRIIRHHSHPIRKENLFPATPGTRQDKLCAAFG